MLPYLPSTIVADDGDYYFFNHRKKDQREQISSERVCNYMVGILGSMCLPTEKTKTNYEIFKKLGNCSNEEFLNLMKHPFAPKIGTCLDEAIKKGNIGLIKGICIEFLCNKSSCEKLKRNQNCDKDHDVINFCQRISVMDDENSLRGRSVEDDASVTPFQHALMYPFENENSQREVLETLLLSGADLNPLEHEYIDEDNENYEEPVSGDGYQSMEDYECVNRYFFNPILQFTVSKQNSKLTHFIIQNGAKKNYIYNPDEGCLVKEEFLTYQEAQFYAAEKKKFISTKAKINFFFMYTCNELLASLPKELVYKILTDKVITPYHQRVTIAKRELRERGVPCVAISRWTFSEKEKLAAKPTCEVSGYDDQPWDSAGWDDSSDSDDREYQLDANWKVRAENNKPLKRLKNPRPLKRQRVSNEENEGLAMDIHNHLFRYTWRSDRRR